jgi:Phytanoyl-CoA dioxygenase (PhyH)
MSQQPSATDQHPDLGWAGPSRDDPEVIALRDHLEAHNGIRGLDILEPTEIERAVRLFDRDGFVVVRDALTPEQTEFLAHGVMEVVTEIVSLDDGRDGNRGSHRYSFGATSITRSMLHRPEWQMLIDLPTVTPIITAIFGSADYMVRSGSGDFCLPGAIGYQPLHADMRDFVDTERTPFSSFSDRRGFLTTRDLPVPYVCVNFLPFDQTALNGPTRQIPGTQNARVAPPTLDEEPEWMRLSTVCPAPAGSIQIRDVRAWHGGTPNVSDQVRAIPNIEFYAPWFREPTIPGISYADHQTLSPHAQHITRHLVQDSSEELETGYSFRPYTPFRKK